MKSASRTARLRETRRDVVAVLERLPGFGRVAGAGCDVIALDHYTSIVTRNATALALPHVGLTTGNSYTIALAWKPSSGR